MAYAAFKSTLSGPVSDGVYGGQFGRPNDPLVASAAVTAAAIPVAAALAVLVADGASPTQAHVNTLNAAYTTLAAAIVTNAAALSGDIEILVNKSTLDTRNKFLSLFRQLQRHIEGTY